MEETLIRIMRHGQQGYNCSQILLLMALENRQQTNPDLVRAMAGLAYGGGGGRATCGALTGGCCMLAYLAADADDDPGRPAEQLPAMLQSLGDWFHERVVPAHGAIACEAIVGEAGPAASRQTCGTLVADTYHRVLEIISSYGFEL